MAPTSLALPALLALALLPAPAAAPAADAAPPPPAGADFGACVGAGNPPAVCTLGLALCLVFSLPIPVGCAVW